MVKQVAMTQTDIKEYLPTHDERRMLKPAVTFRKTGIITINKVAAKRMGLSAGDRITFCQDENSHGDWYLKKHPKGILLSPGKLGRCLAYWKYIVLKIFESIDFYGSSVSIPVVCDPDEKGLYPLITRAAKDSTRVYDSCEYE